MLTRFLAFAVVGGIATALHYAILLLAVEVLGWPAVISSAVGFCTAVTVNYGLNYRYTFASRAPHVETASRFLLVATCGLGINTGTMALLVHGLGFHYLPSQVAATALTLAWNFSVHHFWTFGTAGTPADRDRS